MQYIVYKIEVNSVVVYIGYTKDLKRREYQHNYNLKKGYKKELYDFLRGINIDDVKLISLASFKRKTDAKRFEMYLILHYKFIRDSVLEVPIFDYTELKQTIPIIR